jgi:hypothetical protein
MVMPAPSDPRRYAPAAKRNRAPILAVLARILPPAGTVLEIASGTGEHVVHFAAALPALRWQPSDPDESARASIAAWRRTAGLGNIAEPAALDAAAPHWPLDEAAAVLAINMIHIAPWAAACGLVAGAARLLPPGAPLYLYGPFRRDGVVFADSNRAFDESLRARDPAWGVRRLEAVAEIAAEAGFMLSEIVEMPAQNLSVIFRRG